ncbi:MAG TPA: SagB/ThcOx family dehydrogenase [Anaerolineaceae bacterium]|nr:SagB/ThcOx family dehydrogenase [Chloroflexota bacterium]HOA21173.1 SagB/ThcOx family dehydrogenase [Anaerolineaceae bacterium]HOG77626.1 SagB/ThcOx family dehydrogenase [Anaerolineaceae bacterium]
MQQFDQVGAEFVLNSCYSRMGPTPEKQGQPFPEYLPETPAECELVALPDPAINDLGHADLREVIEQRRSVRRYDEDAALSLEELSLLLWLTQGVKKVSEKTGMSLRTSPSAGARHPFETLLAVRRVQDLEPGVYHFIAHRRALLPLVLGTELLDQIGASTGNQAQVLSAAVNFIWTALPYRTSFRYGARAYRYLFLDAGHVCQNLHLAAESIGCGVCAIGAFEDEAVNAALGLDGRQQFVIYMASVGKKTV